MSDEPEPGADTLMVDTVQAHHHLIGFLITALHQATPDVVERYLELLHERQRTANLPREGPVALQIDLIETAIANLDHS